MKLKIFILLLGIQILPANVFSNEEKTQADVDKEISLLKTCEEAITYFHSRLDEKSKNLLRRMGRNEMYKFHLSTGEAIRNHFDLWNENSPIRKSCAKDNGLEEMHPNDASHYMIEQIWDKTNET